MGCWRMKYCAADANAYVLKQSCDRSQTITCGTGVRAGSLAPMREDRADGFAAIDRQGFSYRLLKRSRRSRTRVTEMLGKALNSGRN